MAKRVAFLGLTRENVMMLMSPASRPARLHFTPNGFRQMSAGDHVLCALSGAPIALEDLRYWSARRQEAYASAALATEALTGKRPAAEASVAVVAGGSEP